MNANILHLESEFGVRKESHRTGYSNHQVKCCLLTTGIVVVKGDGVRDPLCDTCVIWESHGNGANDWQDGYGAYLTPGIYKLTRFTGMETNDAISRQQTCSHVDIWTAIFLTQGCIFRQVHMNCSIKSQTKHTFERILKSDF